MTGNRQILGKVKVGECDGIFLVYLTEFGKAYSHNIRILMIVFTVFSHRSFSFSFDMRQSFKAVLCDLKWFPEPVRHTRDMATSL